MQAFYSISEPGTEISKHFNSFNQQEDIFMRAKPIKAKEQYRLIMECRSSGLTDHQWCLEHDIKPGTFYNWVKRLRSSGCGDIPAASRSQTCGRRQEIVKIEMENPGVFDCSPTAFRNQPKIHHPMPGQAAEMEILSSDWSIRIPNGTDPDLLRLTLQMLGAGSC